MWRLPCLRRSTLPVAVTLNRLATAFLVLAMPAFLDIGARMLDEKVGVARCFSLRQQGANEATEITRSQKWESEKLRISKIKVVLIILNC
jgi:hypothetical protein